MKSTILFFLALFSGTSLLFAQAPQAINYQTIIRDAAGVSLGNQTVGIRLSILSGSPLGTNVYSESHIITTDELGLINLQIGNGTVIIGTFNSINWGNDHHFLKVEVDFNGGTNYVHMGTMQFWSVPYALYSQRSGDTLIAGSGINITGNLISNTAPNVTHTGDATGTTALSVVKIQGRDISVAAPSVGQVLKWDSIAWVPGSDNNSGGTVSGSGNATRIAFWDGASSLSGDSNLFWNNTLSRLGIGTEAPTARLQVSDSSVVFTGPATLSGTPGVPPISGDGNRMMWYADKAAFRTGGTDGTQWDKDNTGVYSFASGYRTTASGGYSVAYGLMGVASGDNSAVFGSNNTASGNGSSAFGSSNVSSGHSSAVFGQYNMASGNRSVAFGGNTTAQSFSSFVVGRYNVITGNSNSWIDSDPLFIAGNGTSSSAPNNAITLLKNGRMGIGTAVPAARLHVSDSAVVFTGSPDLPPNPSDPPIDGAGIRMMWYPDKAAFRAGRVSGTQWDKDNIGTCSFVAGKSSIASGDVSAAIGFLNTASGHVSCSFGWNTTASGEGASTFGGFTTASGQFSTSFGLSTVASGSCSAAFGSFSSAQSYNSAVFGRYNIISGSPDTWSSADPLFVVGNGSGPSSRGNALTILKNGNVGIYEAAPIFRLAVGCGDLGEVQGNLKNWVELSGSSNNWDYLRIVHRRYTSGNTWGSAEIRIQKVVDNSSFMNYISFKGTNGSGGSLEFGYGDYSNPQMTLNSAGTLFINATGSSAHKLYVNGSAYSTISWQSSDEKFKNNIHAIENPLETLSKINGKTYHWKTSEYPQFGKDGQKQYGFIAQEVEEILPELVDTDLNGEKALCYDQFVPILVEAVKELKKQNEALRVRIEMLENK